MHVAQSPGRVTFTRTKKLCVDKREAKEALQEARSTSASMVYVLFACCDSCIADKRHSAARDLLGALRWVLGIAWDVS